MPNERKTEKIVRTHFEKFEDKKLIKIEEQSSESPRINKLLKNASKSGYGKGFPEFIITISGEEDFIIVIECKASNKFHKSKNLDKPKFYAVDGALLYSSYLKKEFDVLSIGVSGTTGRELRVTHHLELKNSSEKPIKKFKNELLTIDDYLEQYKTSEEKFRQDYASLLDFSRELNKTLQTKKIEEDKRALLIGGILIALENKSFRKIFTDYDISADLAKELYAKIELQYKTDGINDERLDSIMEQLAFVKSHPNFSKGSFLINLIQDIDKNINSFIRIHRYYDILGELYIEFLRYANTDKGLGIVLTPRHITEFMAKLAEADEKSVVYDNCTGTGGFLVSAMRLMMEKANGNTRRINFIKRKQLIGIEYQPKIYALAVSNMFIHQDGKTNILQGDCFSKEIVKHVKAKRANVGLLNPPYKANKKDDPEEFEFVLNNLECLEQGAKCVSILPMSLALESNGKTLELKRKLFEQHTLEAVLSMPDELFYSSKVSQSVCIMIFTAHKSHPRNKTTFFGYFKNDEFVKIKNKGRVDLFNRWPEIEKEWIELYVNKKNVVGSSINKVVAFDDEWCAEAYMKTDYSDLTKKDFEQTIRDFIAFKIKNEI